LPERLNVDLIDYPGEWLIDLAMLEQGYEAWALEALDAARAPTRASEARSFIEFVTALDPGTAADEQLVIRGAKLFTDYLSAARETSSNPTVLGPGRVLLPGDLEGSPLLTFFPLAHDDQNFTATPGSLGAMLERRFRSYKQAVVVPFFETHFSRLDRQIVLVDALGAINGGPDALRDLEHAMQGILAAFRPGRSSFLTRLMGRRRVDRLLFAASKADLLNRRGHQGLEAILRKAVSRAERRAEDAGAAIEAVALAGLRATEDMETVKGGERFLCIRGIPEAGQQVAGKRFDGRAAAVIFPGDLPDDPLQAFETGVTAGRHRFVKFTPPRVSSRDTLGQTGDWPHIGLDRVVAFLLGDHLP
jgi:predicted YcjX-like family ATPase